MSEGLTKAELEAVRRYRQPILALGGRAVSDEAKALVAHVLTEVVLPTLSSQQKRPSSLPAIERAVEGTLAGLMLAHGDEWGGWRSRPMSNDSFTGEPVSVRQFQKVYAALSQAGLLDTAPAFFDRSGPEPRGAETRVRVSDAARISMVEYGLSGEGQGHFSLK